MSAPQRVMEMRGMVANWGKCTNCPLGERAHKHVFYRGFLKARVAFVGEGPGRSEDVLGEPFVGRAGRLLNAAIRASGGEPDSCFFTNLVACRPCDGIGGANRPPSEKEVEECSPRLRTTLDIVQPKAIVWLGKVPQFHAQTFHGEWLSFYLHHPSYLLRCGGEKSEQYRTFVTRLKEVFKQWP